ncbi:PASTA domain-containing protein [Nonomuraea sp. NPDC049695]|uniref:PASTA domain-containing protein n=1 Tax=Nonomuraea sp. NPDC049695 TaxID=3154734 RepID=UPI003433DFB2
MRIENDLADAMTAHVADVQAPPDLGRSVRRRHRSRAVRFRVAGAALVTAALAVAVPVTLNSAELAGTANTASGRGQSVVETGSVTVPRVTGERAAEAIYELRNVGLRVDSVATEMRNGFVRSQSPGAGEKVGPRSHVEIGVEPPPQDLGDLGDGRKFGAVRVGYLPDGFTWGRWSGKDWLGAGYATGFDKPAADDETYWIEVMVYEGVAVKGVYTGFPRTGAQIVDVNGKEGRLANLSEAGEVEPFFTDKSTLTMAWKLRDDLAVKLRVSPDYEIAVGNRVHTELKKIARGIRAIN